MVLKIIGWILFVYGITGTIFALIMNPIGGIVGGILIGIPCVWGGWKLAHRKPKGGKVNETGRTS
ncbi:hypothetical protein ACFLXO_01280 [Chloroflexota bacterium]